MFKIRVNKAYLLAVAVGFFTLSGTDAALADSNVQVFGGGQFDFSNFVYFGATVPLSPPSADSGFAVRGLVDTGGYNYINEPLGTIKANFGGGELDAVYQFKATNSWNDFALGVNDTYTGLTPFDPSNRLAGEQAELRMSIDGGHISGPWRMDWFGYYGPRLGDYEALLGGTHSLSSIWRLGLQAYTEGNPSYNLYQVGPYAGFSYAKDAELQFSAGEAWESGFTPRAYVKALFNARI